MDLHYAAHVPAGDGPFPCVLALHGWGANAHDLLGLAPYLHGGESLMLCPEGPVAFEIQPGQTGHGWFPLSAGGSPDTASFERGAEAVRAFLEAAQQLFPIDPRKIALLGFSQGGVVAYVLALEDPGRFAGLAALSSWLPEPLVASLSPTSEHKALPVFVSHGTSDPMIPVDRGRDSRDALLDLGAPTTYREYEMGHEIRAEALRDLVDWLDRKVFQPIQLA